MSDSKSKWYEDKNTTEHQLHISFLVYSWKRAVLDFGSSPESRRFALTGVVPLVIEDLCMAGHRSTCAYIRALTARKRWGEDPGRPWFFDKQRLIFLSVQTERPVRTGESVVVFPFIGLYLPMGGLKSSLLYKIRGSGVFLTLFGTGILSFSL